MDFFYGVNLMQLNQPEMKITSSDAKVLVRPNRKIRNKKHDRDASLAEQLTGLKNLDR